MRLDYLDYQIVYLEDTGDASVYQSERKIMHAFMDRGLEREKVVDCLSYVMRMPEVLKILSKTAC